MIKKSIPALVVLTALVLWLPLAGDIHKAARDGDLNKVKAILAKDPMLVNTQDSNLSTPLHHAADKGHLELSRFLVDKGADINALDVSGRPPLMGAAYRGYIRVVDFLLKQGAKFEVKDTRGYTVYEWATFRGHRDVIDLFVAKGAQVNLHVAAASGHVDLAKKLIAKGADIKARNPDGQTPFHVAVMSSQPQTADLLLKEGIDINIKNKKNETAFDIAIERKIDKMIQWLRPRGGKMSPVPAPDMARLKKDVYRFFFPYGIRSNIGVKPGKKGVLLVDTGFSRRAVKRLRQEIQKISKGDILYIINSHAHWDHVRGNDIATTSTRIINYKGLDDLVKKGILLKGKGKFEGKRGASFDSYYILNFDKEKIYIFPNPGIHSGTDMLTYFPVPGVVHMGDLYLSRSFPAVGESIKEYLKFLNKVINVFPAETTFISGHGPETDLKGVILYRNMLFKTIGIVKKQLAAGKTLQQVKKEKVLKDFESWSQYLPFLNTDYWIGAIYQSYK